MSQTFHYFSPTTPGNPSWDVDLGAAAVRLGEMPGFVDAAELMTVGMSSLPLDDPDGTLGYNNDAIVGLKQFYVDESAVPGYSRMYTGYIADRRYSRGSAGRFLTGAARLIDVSLLDVNALAGFRVFQPAALDATSSFVRPAETAGARIAALLAVDFVSTTIYDEGLVDLTDSTPMDANDYTWQRPVDVILDVCQQSGRNAFLYYDAPSGHDALFYHRNDELVYPAAADISNVLADIGPTVLPANNDWVLTRDPSRVFAGYGLSYRGGNVYESNLNTSYIYGYRDGYASSGNLGTAAKATARANRYLTENSTEDDRLAGTVLIPAANIQDIRAGQYLHATFSHLPGYESGRHCRVLRREVGQSVATDQFYTVRLELTPMPAPAVYFYALLDHGSGFYGPPTPLYFPDGAEVVVWGFNGDHVGNRSSAGWSVEPSSGLIEGIDASPSGWTWRGIRVLAFSVIRIDMQGGYGGVAGNGATITVDVRRNGTIIHTETQLGPTFPPGGFGGWYGTFTFHLSAIEAQANDEFEIGFSTTGWVGFQFFAAIPGELNPDSHFRITAP